MPDAALFIAEVTADETLPTYSQNLLKQRAVERSFEIVGEAMRRLRDSEPELLRILSDSARIIGFRNVLIHGYDSIENRVVWIAIREDLPILIAEIRALRGRLESEGSAL